MEPVKRQASAASSSTRGGAQGDVLGSSQLRGYYRENMMARRDALETLRLDVQDAPEQTAEAARRIAHALAASAAVFGYAEVAEKAVSVELNPGEALGRAMDELIRTLDNAIARDGAGTVKVLVVEPDPDAAALLTLSLSDHSREVHAVASLREAEAVLDAEEVALVILALELPDADGRNLLMRIRSRSRTGLVPVVVLAESETPQVKAECLALGANAFYSKPFDVVSLSASIGTWLQRRGFLDSRDALTGIPDRNSLGEAYARILGFHAVTRDPVCLAVLDFDHLASVNAIYGYPTGDRVLRRSAELMMRSLRNADVLGRWNGDRFVVLLPGIGLESAVEVLERASQAVRHEAYRSGTEDVFHTSFSAGLVELPDPQEGLENAVRRAEVLLVQAQRSGRGRIQTPATEAVPRRPTVLVVEDDEVIAQLLVYRLVREGYEVTHFGDGAVAFEALRTQDPDLILLDVRLPGLDGFEVLRRIRRSPAHLKTPIIMLTAMGSEGDLVQGFQLGADDYVLKPFSPVELAARVKRFLKRNA